MEFFSQEYWSRQPFPSPGDLPNPGIEPRSPTLQTDSLPSEPPEKLGVLYYPPQKEGGALLLLPSSVSYGCRN